jgi:hypothetical protein
MSFASPVSLLAVLVAALLLGACEQKPSQPLAPEADALASAKPGSAGSVKVEVVPASSKVTFEMDAELERIFGRAPGSLNGELYIDQKDLTKSSGLIKVDLLKLTMSQRKRKTKDEDYGEERTVDKQVKDALTWLQISEDAPAPEREKNRWAEFKLEKFESATPSDLAALSGPERKTTAIVSGDFRMHGRVTKKQAKLEATLRYDGDELRSISVKTLEPVSIGLEEHDVRPRKGFGVLADTTLEALGAKVAKVAQVSFEFEAVAK